MATVSLTSAFNTDLFWSPRPGVAITKTATIYEFQNAAGFYVRVTGTGLTYAGEAPSTGTYTAVAVYSDNTFTTKVADFSSASALAFATFFSAGASTALAGVDIVFGSPGNDTIFGHGGNDTIIAGDGLDSLAGGLGNDSYYIGAGDSVVEAAGGGTDTVSSSSVSIDLALSAFANIENAELTGSTAGLNAAGTAGANRLSGEGNTSANVLTGRGGNDVYYVGAGDSVVETASGGIDIAVSSTTSIDLGTSSFRNVENAQLNGSLALKLSGSSGANTLFGETNSAANVLTGRGGNDTYFVGAGDSVVETKSGGIDIAVSSSVSIDLGTSRFKYVENVELKGSKALKAAGSSGDNVLYGVTSTAANVLTGRGGNDTYVVGKGDRAVETSHGGNDTAVSSTVSIKLGTSAFANVENARLEGSKVLKAFGSSGANTLFGESNSAANVLTGRGGNDAYVVGRGDKVVETAHGGTDAVYSSTLSLDLRSSKYANVEDAGLIGTRALSLTGDDGGNRLVGNAGANKLAGGKGLDSLTGLAGRDVFIFTKVTDSGITNDTRDVIFDFTHGVDRIDLAKIDANTKAAGDQSFKFLKAKDAHFTGKAGELHYLAAGSNTLVEADLNGDGKGDFQILLVGTKTLTIGDFHL